MNKSNFKLFNGLKYEVCPAHNVMRTDEGGSWWKLEQGRIYTFPDTATLQRAMIRIYKHRSSKYVQILDIQRLEIGFEDDVVEKWMAERRERVKEIILSRRKIIHPHIYILFKAYYGDWIHQELNKYVKDLVRWGLMQEPTLDEPEGGLTQMGIDYFDTLWFPNPYKIA